MQIWMEWNGNLKCNTQTAQLEKARSLNIALHVNVAGFSVTSNRGLLLFDSVSASLRRTNNRSRSLCWSLIVQWTPGGSFIFSRIFGILPSSNCCYEVFGIWIQNSIIFFFTDGHSGGIFRLGKICDCFDLFWSFFYFILPAIKLNASPFSRSASSTDRSSIVSHWPGSGASVFGWILREIISWIRCQVIFSTRASRYFGKGGSESEGLFYMFILFLSLFGVCVCHCGLNPLTDSCLLVFLMKSCCLLSFYGDRLLHRLQHNLQHIQIFLEHTLTILIFFYMKPF